MFRHKLRFRDVRVIRDKNGNEQFEIYDYPEWRTEKLGALGTFEKGGGLSKSDISGEGNPCILYGELYTTYGEVAHEIKSRTNREGENFLVSRGGEVLIPCSGETPEDISTATCVPMPGVIFGGDLIVFFSDKIDGRVLSYILNYRQKLNIARLAQGKSIVHISVDMLKGLEIDYPESIDEQQKIASFFSMMDSRIQVQQSIITDLQEQRKGLIQKVFKQEIRFKEKDGRAFPDWKERKLEGILHEYNEKASKGKEYEHVSLTKEGVIPKSQRYERDFLVTQEDKQYRITHYNDICYNPANLKFGVICRNKYKDAIFSPIYITFRVADGFLPEFVELLVTRKDFINDALRYEQGTVYERMSVSPEDLLSLAVKVPCYEEQEKIAKFFTVLESRIENEKAILSDLEQLKKGLLQRMF